jgi:hypothetical protein
MSPRRTLRSLQNVAAIRSLQEVVHEQRVAAAAVEVSRLSEGRREAAHRADQTLSSWLEHHHGGPINLALAGLMGHALLDAEDHLAQAGAALQNGEHAYERQTHALREARARREAAEQLRDKTARKGRRLAEERRVAEMADRAAFRQRKP